MKPVGRVVDGLPGPKRRTVVPAAVRVVVRIAPVTVPGRRAGECPACAAAAELGGVPPNPRAPTARPAEPANALPRRNRRRDGRRGVAICEVFSAGVNQSGPGHCRDYGSGKLLWAPRGAAGCSTVRGADGKMSTARRVTGVTTRPRPPLRSPRFRWSPRRSITVRSRRRKAFKVRAFLDGENRRPSAVHRPGPAGTVRGQAVAK